MALSPRTKKLLSWLPATLLLVIIAGVIVATVAVQNSWWAEERPDASVDQKASDGSSMLTDAGFDYVNVEGVVRLRVGDGALSATELGLGADAEKSAEFRRPVRALIAAGDDVHVVPDVAALTAVSEGDEVASVTVWLDTVSGWSGAVNRLRILAPSFGWDPAEVDAFAAQIAEFNRAGEGDTFTTTIGPAEGAVRITGTLEFNRATGATPISITFEPDA